MAEDRRKMPLKECDKYSLRWNRSYLVDHLDEITNILEHLFARFAITEDKYESIILICKTKPRRDQVRALLDCINLSYQHTFDVFMKAVTDTQSFLVDRIRKTAEDYIPPKADPGHSTGPAMESASGSSGRALLSEGASRAQSGPGRQTLDTVYEKSLTKNKELIVEKLTCLDAILDRLDAEGAIDKGNYQKIRHAGTDMEKNRLLVDYIRNSSQGTFNILMEVLEEKQPFLADEIYQTAGKRRQPSEATRPPEPEVTQGGHPQNERPSIQPTHIPKGAVGLQLIEEMKNLTVGGNDETDSRPGGATATIDEEKENKLKDIIQQNNWGEFIKFGYEKSPLTLKIKTQNGQIQKLHADFEDGTVKGVFQPHMKKMNHGDDPTVQISQKDLFAVTAFLEAPEVDVDGKFEMTYCKNRNTEGWYWSMDGIQWQTTETAVIATKDKKDRKPKLDVVDIIKQRFGQNDKPGLFDKTPCKICVNNYCHPKYKEPLDRNMAFDEIDICLKWDREIYWETSPATGDLIHGTSTDDSAQEDTSGPKRSYEMSGDCKGRACIIDIHTFSDPKTLPTLHGYEQDTLDLKKLWTGLGFIVAIPKGVQTSVGLTALEIKAAVKEFAGQLTRKDRCAILCFSSHGSEGNVYGSDGQQVTVDELLEELNNDNCTQMAGKPKVVIFQACQGSKEDLGIMAPAGAAPSSDVKPPRRSHFPTVSDLIVCTPSLQGYISFVCGHPNNQVVPCSPECGSYYMQKLVEVFKKYAHEEDVLTMLTMVNDEVSEKSTPYVRKMRAGGNPNTIVKIESEQKQMPEFRSTLRKKLFFR